MLQNPSQGIAGLSGAKRYTITAALPYTNGPIHIGHLAGVYVPSDIYSRYLRLKGRDVLFVCGSDEHGRPRLLATARRLVPWALASHLMTTQRGCDHEPAWYQNPVKSRCDWPVAAYCSAAICSNSSLFRFKTAFMPMPIEYSMSSRSHAVCNQGLE